MVIASCLLLLGCFFSECFAAVPVVREWAKMTECSSVSGVDVVGGVGRCGALVAKAEPHGIPMTP